jgi:heavy metal sensor kinase
MPSSIKTRIITFYLAVLFVSLSILGVFLYFSHSKIVYQSIDSSLLSRAKALATLFNEDNNETEFNFSDEIMSEYNSSKAKSFFQIRRLDGTVIERSTSLGNLDLPFGSGEKRTDFKTIFLNGVPVRLVNFHFSEESDLGDREKGFGTKHARHDFFIIQCAENIQKQIAVMKDYGLVLSLSVFFVMIISASGGFFIARKALSPIKEITKTISRISESNLSQRIRARNIPKELRGLAASFNRTFDRLEKSFRRQKQFTADASHELRTPLSVILSQSEITLRKQRTAEEYKNALMAIEEAGKLMSEIVVNLLATVRLGADKVEFRIESIDLNKIIRQAVKLLTPLAEEKGISINLAANEHTVIHGDRTAILELFVNIIDNAIKYNISRGKIDISIKKENPFIVTEIKDTGVGIAEEDLDRVFDRFYRIDKSRSKEISGTGLGLSICDEIARLHGGRIKIESRVGRETTVSVYLKGDGMF